MENTILIWWAVGCRPGFRAGRYLLVEWDRQAERIVRAYFPVTTSPTPRQRDLRGRDYCNVDSALRTGVFTRRLWLKAAAQFCRRWNNESASCHLDRPHQRVEE